MRKRLAELESGLGSGSSFGTSGTTSAATSASMADEASLKPAAARGLARPANPENLACFRLVVAAFEMPLWQSSGRLKASLQEIELGVIKALGAGYYSFGHRKRDYYNQARAELGAALALLYRYPNERQKPPCI